MEDFRRQFLNEYTAKLKHLSSDLQNSPSFSDAAKRAAFRTLHTVKGTAQTFNLPAASRLAHELETVLATLNDGNSSNPVLQNLLVEGINFLTATLAEKNFQTPSAFVGKIRAACPQVEISSDAADDFPPEIPPDILNKLSPREKTTLRNCLADGKIIYGLEIFLTTETFAAAFRDFRAKLDGAGEIIATFPAVRENSDGHIGFQILFAGALPKEISAKIIFQTAPEIFAENIRGVLRQIVRHGTDTAKNLDKKISFEILSDDAEIAPAQLKIVFETLLHLVRNAVDHAVKESAGHIEIRFKAAEKNLHLTVSDDGDGIDFEKVRAKAIEKNLIADDKILTEAEAIELIFAPEFSTADKVSEISGRGIGLDAVKKSVEAANGKISVKTATGKGTTFEVSLPR